MANCRTLILPLKTRKEDDMVQIIDGWYFNMDENQYILVHKYMWEKQDFKTRKGTGEWIEKKDEVGYFRTVTAMLRRLAEFLVRDKIAEGEIKTIREYIDEMERIEKRLHEMVKGY